MTPRGKDAFGVHSDLRRRCLPGIISGVSGSKLSNLRVRLGALRSGRLTDVELSELLLEVIQEGGGVSLDVDGSTFKVVRRESHYGFHTTEPRRPSTIPPRRE